MRRHAVVCIALVCCLALSCALAEDVHVYIGDYTYPAGRPGERVQLSFPVFYQRGEYVYDSTGENGYPLMEVVTKFAVTIADPGPFVMEDDALPTCEVVAGRTTQPHAQWDGLRIAADAQAGTHPIGLRVVWIPAEDPLTFREAWLTAYVDVLPQESAAPPQPTQPDPYVMAQDLLLTVLPRAEAIAVDPSSLIRGLQQNMQTGVIEAVPITFPQVRLSRVEQLVEAEKSWSLSVQTQGSGQLYVQLASALQTAQGDMLPLLYATPGQPPQPLVEGEMLHVTTLDAPQTITWAQNEGLMLMIPSYTGVAREPYTATLQWIWVPDE